MTIFRVSGDGLLRLAVMAAQSPEGDFDTILAILRGADPELPEMPDVGDGPILGVDEGDDDPAPVDPAPVSDAVKPAKPE